MTISFSSFLNPEWKDKIDLGLDNYLETQIGLHAIQPQGIYCFYETQLVGGIVFKKQGDILWIDGLYIEPPFRRQKIGTKLLKQLSDYAQQQSIKCMQLNTYFSEAKDFFKALDFEEITSIPNWKYGLTCYFMKKDL